MSKPKYDVPDNVNTFLDKAAAKYGEIKADEFSQRLWSDCRSISSPIEQLFLIAIRLVGEHMLTEVDVVEAFSEENDNLQVIHQWKAGNYLVDFALRRHPIDKIVCVELDGHKFHDRNEKQRRYEKQRDRFFMSREYALLHYTGSEVNQDPCAVALEAFVFATNLRDVASHPLTDD